MARAYRAVFDCHYGAPISNHTRHEVIAVGDSIASAYQRIMAVAAQYEADPLDGNAPLLPESVTVHEMIEAPGEVII